jgi:hypothetical protein
MRKTVLLLVSVLLTIARCGSTEASRTPSPGPLRVDRIIVDSSPLRVRRLPQAKLGTGPQASCEGGGFVIALDA